jgi:hypothetical protein
VIVGDPANCGILWDLKTDMFAFFQNSGPGSPAYEAWMEIYGLCHAGSPDMAQIANAAWQMLELVEQELAGGGGEDLEKGASLVGGLLSCTETLCRSDGIPGIDFLPTLGTAGLFAVRGNDQKPAVARGYVPFTDFLGGANSALWGVEVDLPWSVVTQAPRVLIFGFAPPAPELPVAELRLGGLEYELKVYPKKGEFPDGTLHVTACFADDVELPHVDGDHSKPSLEPLMQRQSVLLETYAGPGFCDPPSSMQHASILAPVAALARRIAAPVRAYFFTDRGIKHVGGTPLDFSRFAPVVVNGQGGGLELLSGPNADVTVGESVGTIRVRASTDNGTPIERVEVTLSIYNNRGVPAGAVLSGSTVELTEERDGLQGVATFTDVSVGKPGGYIICAEGSFQEFTFERVCSTRINAKW